MMMMMVTGDCHGGDDDDGIINSDKYPSRVTQSFLELIHVNI